MLAHYRLPRLPFRQLELTFLATAECRLPQKKGALLRGVFGKALYTLFCQKPTGALCEDCALNRMCPYTRIFHTLMFKPPPRFLRGVNTTPRPYIIYCENEQTHFKKDDAVSLVCTLIGNDAVDLLEFIVAAAKLMGRAGFGEKRTPFALLAVYQIEQGVTKHLIYRPPTKALRARPEPQALHAFSDEVVPTFSTSALIFQSPLRLKTGNKLLREFNFRALLFRMIRRINELTYFHGNEKDVQDEFHDLLCLADQISAQKIQLQWEEQQRYSGRQKQKYETSGFVGSVLLSGDLRPFWGILKSCEILHLGKGAVLGNGKITLKSPITKTKENP